MGDSARLAHETTTPLLARLLLAQLWVDVDFHCHCRTFGRNLPHRRILCIEEGACVDALLLPKRLNFFVDLVDLLRRNEILDDDPTIATNGFDYIVDGSSYG